MQTVNFGSFGCSPSTSSDFAEMHRNQAKKLDLAERIRMHRSRASGASNLSRYGLFCMALWCTLFLLVNALERFIMAHGHVKVFRMLQQRDRGSLELGRSEAAFRTCVWRLDGLRRALWEADQVQGRPFWGHFDRQKRSGARFS